VCAASTAVEEVELRQDTVLKVEDEHFSSSSVCMVTGAGSGIGRALSFAACANGLHVVGLDINEAGMATTQELCRRVGGEMTPVKTDLTVDGDIERAVEHAARVGKITFLANLAGIQYIAAIEDYPMDKYDLMQRLMLRAPFYLAKLVMPHMKRNSDGIGVIGNMASIQSHICTLNKAPYNMIKFGLRGLTQSIAAEGAGKIRSFSVSTGFVKTPMTLGQIHPNAVRRGISDEEVVRDVMLGRSQVKEMMDAIDVANIFIFGFSHHARHLVGGDLLFDGGIVLTY
jgi:3-hydroxybutyrate dehydrogenase